MAKQQKKTEQKTEMMSPKDVGQSREVEAALTKSSRLLFLTLLQGGSDIVNKKQIKGAEAGGYVLGGKDYLGLEFEAIVTISRPRAMIWEDGKVTLESFDPSSEEWAKCKATKKGGNTGIEFLIWIPKFKAFATYYFKNTAREVGADAARCRDEAKMAVFTSRFVEGKSNSWYVPVVEPSDDIKPVNLPSKEDQAEAVAAFESYKLESKAEPESRPR